MSQLIALVIAIVLGAVVTAIGYVFLGGAFAEQSVKAEAQKILAQAEQIEAAMIAYKLDNNGVITLGESDPNNDGDYSDNEIFKHLIDGGYLKNNINEAGETELSWHLAGDTNGNGICEGSESCTIQRVVPNSDQCIQANYQKNRYPEDGLEVGDVLPNGYTVQSDDVSSEGVPICNAGITGAACCVVL
tara:strand:- start:13945 stop:14511 length:567 start_codon:yes stop_codon:yes gene_type:complete